MLYEIIITIGIFLVAGFILYKNIKKKGKGTCDCGSCSSHCVNYKKEHKS